MKRALISFAAFYVASCAFCALVPDAVVAKYLSILWLFGPPASLVYGTNFLWPFAIGTALVAGSVFGITRTESPGVQVVSGLALPVVWAFFGFLAYAPGA